MVYVEGNTWGIGSRMTLDQIRDCPNYGMMPCAHRCGTYFDKANKSNMVSDETVRAWCRSIKQAMLNAGLTEGAEYFAIPIS